MTSSESAPESNDMMDKLKAQIKLQEFANEGSQNALEMEERKKKEVGERTTYS